MKYKKLKKINCKEKINKKTSICKKLAKSQKMLKKFLNLQNNKQEFSHQFSQNQDFNKLFTIQQYKYQKLYMKQCFQNVCSDSFNKFQSKNIQQQFDNFIEKNGLNITSQSQPTVDILLNMQNHRVWPIQQKYQDLIHYIQYLNYCLPKYGKKIILRTTKGALCLTLQNERRQETDTYLIEQLSEIQCFIFQNRSLFMEKIQLHEQKYSSTSTRLSQLSKQILFLFKFYKQNHEKTNSVLKQIKDKISVIAKMQKNFEHSDCIIKYYEILIKKNIKHAFNQEPIQRLNYFKKNEIRQKSLEYCLCNNKNISNQQQFSNYLKKRRPKKGKSSKFSLSTACSACFSDYYELSNPFTSCDNCFHRCHKLCFDLTNDKCGYCSYQRISKQQKKHIPLCYICKNKGQMCIKLNGSIYCHLFCLLVHNFWKISKRISQNKNNNQKMQNQLQQGKNEKRGDIVEKLQFHQFYMDIQASQIVNNHENIIQNIFPIQNQNNSDIKQRYRGLSDFKIEYIPIINQQRSNNKDIIKVDSQAYQKQQKYDQKQQKCDQKQQKCELCGQSFVKKLYINCQSCYRKYHAFCAFFQGYAIQHKNQKSTYYIKNCQSQDCLNFKQRSSIRSQNKIQTLNDSSSYNLSISKSLTIQSQIITINKNMFKEEQRNSQQFNQQIKSLKQKRHFILNQNKVVFNFQQIFQNIQQDKSSIKKEEENKNQIQIQATIKDNELNLNSQEKEIQLILKRENIEGLNKCKVFSQNQAESQQSFSQKQLNYFDFKQQ